MKKRFGFTLAEVLITLGIIGVVAAMTIPSLIQNTASTQRMSQYKKTFSTLTNATEMLQAHQSLAITDLRQACTNARNDNFDSDTAANRVASICSFINSTLSNVRYINTAAAAYTQANGLTGTAPTWGIGAAGAGAPNTAHVYALSDGSWIAVPAGATNNCRVAPGVDPASAAVGCHGFIDVNGAAAPNQAVTCGGADLTPNTSGVGNAQLCQNFRREDVKDIFPIVFYNDTVAPSSTTARLIISQQK